MIVASFERGRNDELYCCGAGLAAAAFFDRDVDVYSANHGITQITDGIPDILYEAKHGADFVLRSYDRLGNVGKIVTSMGGLAIKSVE